MIILIILSLLLLSSVPISSAADGQAQFTVIDGCLNIKALFIETYSADGLNECGLQCNLEQRCQAFTINDGPCQLFVFDKCSKSVRDCSCTRRGQVFVKQQPGLEPGALCPSDYGDEKCGVKYRMYSGTSHWWTSKAKCETERGLVIMADVVDDSEMSHVEMLYSKYVSGQRMWLGGYQAPGSVEPAGGWYWVGCNITLDGSLWGSGDPDNGYASEHAVGRGLGHNNLADFMEWITGINNVLCECASPFH